jgi:hypothetical protein
MNKLHEKLIAQRPRCAVCDSPIPFGKSGWFCSTACDDADMARRVGLVRLCYAITDAARTARKATA